MTRMWRAVVLFSFTLMSTGAQTTVHAASGPWTAALDGTWRWHAGDNTQWASATFDDSHWSPLRVPGPLPPDRQYWIRLHVQIGGMPDPGLLLGPIAYAYDVYWDGQRIGSFGDLPRGTWFTPRWQTFPIPAHLTIPGDHTVAVRIGQIGPGIATPTRQPGTQGGDNRIGDLAALHEAESAQMHADLQPRLLQLLVDFGFLLAGLYFLSLPPSVSQGAAFRWLGIILLGRALVVMCEFYENDGPLSIPGSIITAFLWAGVWLSCLGTIEFSYAFFRRPVPFAMRCIGWLIAALAAPLPFSYSAITVRLTVLLIPAVVSITVAAAEVRKRTLDAGLTLILFAALGATILYNVLDITIAITYGIGAPVAINIAGFRLWLWDVVYLVWVPAIAMQIHKANLRFRDERERLRREMEAARHVQHLLLPSQSLQVPGFEIEASYQPATEVGGDFFQLFPVSPASLLLVVGDVSGKGVQAALLVSMVVGALRNRQSDEPSSVLQELNAVLLGVSQGGFTTCCCAFFAPDGAVTLANAGHFAPYRNGEEIATPPGLPLGLTSDAEWEERQMKLQPGDRLLWISDGVIEARNDKRELLGFQRTQELAGQPAFEITRAAQEFGQEDDITVLSITRQKVSLGVAAV
ncbi:MAG: PP2C family protein-serine/threonine phosphatase [Bryobacteraceae bacterium]